ncbi:MAG: DnaJ domain-containing protein [Alphaproteobacteria bacterium]|nr:DnaJ domain-containing protein [Alphaproteobacteria bacterium]
MSYLLLGLAVLAAIIVGARFFASANPGQLASSMRWTGVAVCVLVALFFTLTGRLVLGLPAIGLGLLLLIRALGLRGPTRKRSSAGRQSTVETEYLEMVLDHGSGAMAGRVRKGPFSGRDLSALHHEELLALWRECSARDEQSARVLESFLDRHMEGWREAAQAQDEAPKRAGRMTEREARKVLGVDSSAGEMEIKEAHRNLMRKHHPDKGGSSEFAARLNEARELLLEK